MTAITGARTAEPSITAAELFGALAHTIRVYGARAYVFGSVGIAFQFFAFVAPKLFGTTSLFGRTGGGVVAALVTFAASVVVSATATPTIDARGVATVFD